MDRGLVGGGRRRCDGRRREGSITKPNPMNGGGGRTRCRETEARTIKCSQECRSLEAAHARTCRPPDLCRATNSFSSFSPAGFFGRRGPLSAPLVRPTTRLDRIILGARDPSRFELARHRPAQQTQSASGISRQIFRKLIKALLGQGNVHKTTSALATADNYLSGLRLGHTPACGIHLTRLSGESTRPGSGNPPKWHFKLEEGR